MWRWSGAGRLAAAAGGGAALAGAALVLGFPSSPSTGRSVLAAVRQQAGGPVAAFADPGDLTIDASVTFDAGQSRGSSLAYRWDFGDGASALGGATAQHVYSAVDDYRVSLTVQDGQGRTDTTSRTIRAVPSVEELIGDPELKQVVPASSFPAMLAVTAAGPSRVSLKLGGPFLSSDTYDYARTSGPALFEIPDVRVVNEDDPDIRAQLIDQPGATIPLKDNVSVTLTYPVSTGGTESVSFTMSLDKPAATAAASPSPSPQPTGTPAPDASGNAAPSATPGPDGSDRYLQARPTPRPGTATATATPSRTPSPIPTPSPAPSATPAAPVAPPAPSVWAISYPSYLLVVGYPTNADDVNNYYIKGDPEFHAVNDPLLRRYAIKLARNGGVFPNDPQRAADNIYRYVYGLLGIGDPGELQTDLTILGRILSGALVPGERSGEYICIAHAYFLSSLTRTLGLPTRELTIGLGSAADQDSTGAWTVTYYQEGANQVWFDGAWHHYDTWIGTRDPQDYLVNHLNAEEWYAFSEQHTDFADVNGNPVGLAGHDFSIGKYAGSPGSPDEWRFLREVKREGVRIAPPGPEAYQSAERASAAPREPVTAGIRNPAPPAGGP